MGTRDEEYLLKEIVEMDDAFFGVPALAARHRVEPESVHSRSFRQPAFQ